jgi:hypothetical protein
VADVRTSGSRSPSAPSLVAAFGGGRVWPACRCSPSYMSRSLTMSLLQSTQVAPAPLLQ